MPTKYLFYFIAAIAACFLVTGLQPLAWSQQAATATSCDKKTPQNKDDAEAPDGSWLAAFARTFQYDYQYLEQPSRVLVQNASGAAQLVPNPEYNLNQHTFSLDFSQVFVAADLDRARKNVQPWKQAISGLTLKLQLGEHQRVVQQTLLSGTGFLQNYNIGGEADFDPAKVFHDFSSTSRGGNPGFKDRLEETIPKIVFKRTTPFDFVKYGGQLTPTATQNGLNTIQFTWDARRILRRRKPAALDGNGASATEKLCVMRSVTSTSYISAPTQADPTFCQRLANSLGNKLVQLGCASPNGAVFGHEVNSDALLLDDSTIPEGNECNWSLSGSTVARQKY